MAYKLKMKDPTMPDDTLFDFGGFGIKNGSTVTLTAEDEQRIVLRHGMSLKEALGNNPYLDITGTTELKKEGGEG
jgi:hypothetical protein